MYLQGLPRPKLRACFASWGFRPGNADLIYKTYFRHGDNEPENTPGVARGLKDRLRQQLRTRSITPTREVSRDGSTKLLFRLEDGSAIEAVHMPLDGRNTLCVSTQVGCALNCGFCVTGQLPFRRNLAAWEMVEQVRAAHRLFGEQKATNLVFMGMGEPLLNYEELKEALFVLMDPLGLAFPARKLLVSTAGYVPNMVRLGEETGVALAVSLGAATDEKRNRLMSINRKFPLSELIEGIRAYTQATSSFVFCQYVLIAGETDTDADLECLAKLLSGLDIKINLIRFNESPTLPYRTPSEERVLTFQRKLIKKGFFTTIRQRRGADISGACGQLAAGAVPGS